MQIQQSAKPVSAISADALVTYIFDRENKLEGVGGEIDRAMNGRLASLVESGELTGKALELVLVHFPAGLGAHRLLLLGAGQGDKFETGDLRKIAGTALRYLKSHGVKKFVFVTQEGERGPNAAQAVVEGVIAADFESNKYHTEKKPTRDI